MNNKRLLVCSYQPYSVLTVQKFTQELNWQPAVWFVADENRELVKQHYPNALQYDYFDVVKGILPKGVLLSDITPPSPDELERLAKYEHNFLYMLQRNDSNDSAFEYKERLAFYYHILGLWKHIIRKYEIDLIWFEEEPHQAADYGLYLVAKLLGIQTIMTTRTISELGILPYHDFEDGFPELNQRYAELAERFYSSEEKIEISQQIEAYFQKLNADYQTILKEHLWDQVDEYNKLASKKKFNLPSLKTIKKTWATAWNVAARFIKNTAIRSDQYKAGHTMMSSHYSYREYIINKLKAIHTKRKIKQVYERFAVTDMNTLPKGKKFIYVALQYQPEKSTCPLAGRFVDQRYLVKWLVSQLDDSWHILVKEHPSQFISSYTRFGECFRDERYYQELNDIPNVSLMGLSLDSFKLMSSCEAVASAGGTVCWEAVARGIPALSFAISWFRPCHGVFYIAEQNHLKDAVQSIEDGFKPEPYLVKAYAQLIKDYDFYAAIGGASSLNYKNIDEELNAQAHFQAIKHLIA
ncbi:hypothetical protein KIH87_01915 [Paraneptunicella aestuarii]|uniref:hypothetical protein n=1 Tax=Paraneptunicella aestuarii TaxID=2831148 RepID=UPI001E4745DC|nr:hypothetical protein [Paraneptunicella aestuarii]UAA39146.1 hypothetical protein KIH87_01915 [Paraneptunicella aestuarii]